MGYRVMTQALFEQIAALFGDAAQRRQVEELTRERAARAKEKP
jgi:hypothetical protein